MWEDFKKFALKGNVMDLAVAVVIGAAFGKIVASLVSDIITPLMGVLMGGIDFTGLVFEVGSAKVMYGNFIQTVVDFLIVAFAIFIVIRLLMKFQRKKEAVVEKGPAIDSKEALLVEIRDLLKIQKT
ncbi:large conductance mechanosensitive channel protein MscL [Paenisporosarcina indica]|uniref:large conductance mechanosensitive channel protein MscL n=1 Tax=Paenisporosarcina indica TaxID=650093 RepID=UPI00094F6AFB|nr:large conductance mechanosensitive channel protein MscL [Paenisporosarcina indica]